MQMMMQMKIKMDIKMQIKMKIKMKMMIFGTWRPQSPHASSNGEIMSHIAKPLSK